MENSRFGTLPRFWRVWGTWYHFDDDIGKINGFPSSSESLILRNTMHTGSVRGLDFNPIQTNLLASGGVSGEVASTSRTSRHRQLIVIFRYIFGTSKTPVNRILQRLAPAVQSSTRSRLWPGISKSNMYLPAQAAQGTPLSGICEGNARWWLWLTEEERVRLRGRAGAGVVWQLVADGG